MNAAEGATGARVERCIIEACLSLLGVRWGFVRLTEGGAVVCTGLIHV